MVICQLITNFAAIQPVCMEWWVKTYWIPCSGSAPLTADLASATGLTAGQEERTFSERYLLRSNFATLIYQKIPQRSVHFGRLLPLTYGRVALLCHAEHVLSC